MVVGKSALNGMLSASTEQDGERMESTSHIVHYPLAAQLLSEVNAFCEMSCSRSGTEEGFGLSPLRPNMIK